MTDRQKAALALSIISGRTRYELMEYTDFDALGWDSYKFGAFGKPSQNKVLERAEEIVLDLIAPREAGAET